MSITRNEMKWGFAEREKDVETRDLFPRRKRGGRKDEEEEKNEALEMAQKREEKKERKE